MTFDRDQYFRIYEQVLFHLAHIFMEMGNNSDTWEGTARVYRHHGNLMLGEAARNDAEPDPNVLTKANLEKALEYFEAVRGPELLRTSDDETLVRGLIEQVHIENVFALLYPSI